MSNQIIFTYTRKQPARVYQSKMPRPKIQQTLSKVLYKQKKREKG